MISKLTATIIASLVLPIPAMAQITPRQVAAIDSIFDKQIRADGPGCVVGIIRGDSILHWRGYGLADVEARLPFTPQSVFSTGSIYKHFYAAGILLLAREGRLSLDDDIRKYLPEIPDYGRRITIRQLLDHTHGLREFMELRQMTRPGVGTTDSSVLALIARQRTPSAPVGSRFQYGSTGPFLAGVIIERISRMPAAEFTGRFVFDVAHMTLTSLGDSTRGVPPRIPNYELRPDGTLVKRPATLGFRTSLQDLAKWNRHLERADTPWRSIIHEITTPSYLSNKTRLDYGLGMRLNGYRGLRRVWAPGGATGGRAIFMRFPEVRATVALGCNHDMDPITTAESVADVVLAGHFRETPRTVKRDVAISEKSRNAITGTYASLNGDALQVGRTNDRLWVLFRGEEHQLIPQTQNRFEVQDNPGIPRWYDATTFIDFVQGSGGAPKKLIIHSRWYPITFTAVPPVDPAAIITTDYVATYASDETQSELVVAAENGQLTLRAPRGEHRMEAISRDLFVAGPFLVQFTRANNAVEGVLLSRGTLHNVRFDRRGH